jgi:S-adenosylmethionine:tRNA ribosyltransferase-isomerase
VFDRATRQSQHTTFDQLPAHLTRGDLLVVNDTRVFPARLLGHRVPSGGAVECLLIRDWEVGRLGVARSEAQVGSAEEWEALMHPGQKLKPGAQVRFERDGATLVGEVLGRHFYGRRSIRLEAPGGESVAGPHRAELATSPLPPYIKRDDDASDRDRYQTVYARSSGSVAAPTAGLHFTQPLLEELAVARYRADDDHPARRIRDLQARTRGQRRRPRRRSRAV